MSSKGALGFSGVADWILQRVTSVVILVYLIYLFCFFTGHSFHNFHFYVGYDDWVNLFNSVTFKFLTGLFLVSLIIHAWVGVWTIATDYIKGFKLRTLILFACKLLCLIYLAFGLYIIW